MKAKGSELIFISRILRDGSGVEIIESRESMAHMHNEYFQLNRLSITCNTFIARDFNSYVVKLKNNDLEKEK